MMMCEQIVIVQDSDCDGICSSVLFYFLLEHIGYPKEKIMTLFHSGKSHGIDEEIYKQIPSHSLVVVNDAHCESDWGKMLTKRKQCKIISCDHHMSELNEYCTTVNNQHSPLIKNKALSGTGVTFQFIRYYSKKYLKNDKWYAKLLDIVMFGNISDVMSMKCSPYENRFFNVHGVKHINNEFLKYLIQEQCGDDFSLEDLVWNVTPLLSASTRCNNQELKQKLFDCFVGNDTDYEQCLKDLKSNKQKQDYQVKKMMENVSEIHLGSVGIFECDKTPYTGLVANKLLSQYKCPVLLVHNDMGQYSGSVRSNVPTKHILNDSGLFIYNSGHNNVHGTAFKEENLGKIIQFCEENIEETEKEHIVAKSFEANNIPKELFGIGEVNKNLWVTDIQYPLFHIKNIKIKSKDIEYLNKYKTTIKFKYDGVSYIRKYCSKVWRESELSAEMLNIAVIGKLKIGFFDNPEVEIKEIEVKEDTFSFDDIW